MKCIQLIPVRIRETQKGFLDLIFFQSLNCIQLVISVLRNQQTQIVRFTNNARQKKRSDTENTENTNTNIMNKFWRHYILHQKRAKRYFQPLPDKYLWFSLIYSSLFYRVQQSLTRIFSLLIFNSVHYLKSTCIGAAIVAGQSDSHAFIDMSLSDVGKIVLFRLHSLRNSNNLA